LKSDGAVTIEKNRWRFEFPSLWVMSKYWVKYWVNRIYIDLNRFVR